MRERGVWWWMHRGRGWGFLEMGRMGITINLIFKLSTNLSISSFPCPACPLRTSEMTRHTLTSSNGALPTQTTAPLAPPASRLVTATSLAVFPLNIPSFRSTHGASTSFSFPFRDGVVDTAAACPGEELRIRLVEV